MNKLNRFFILTLLIVFSFSIAKAQNKYTLILNQAFNSSKERFFCFSFKSKEQLNQLSKIISIDKVTDRKAYAYASRNDFEKFLDTKIEYQLLDRPNTDFNADMFDPLTKKSYAWNEYLSYPDYVNMMYEFAADYPNICTVFSIGQSVEGREILVAKISDNIDQKEAEPQFLYSGQIHGDELVTSILMLRLIDYLTANYGIDNQVNRLVDNIEIWINPMANPDGTYAGGNLSVNGATRFNANAVDLNRNFPDPENGPNPDSKSRQKETQLFMDLADAQHFVMSANTHAGSTVVNYPWDTWPKLHPDDNWWQMVSHEYADLAQINSPAGYMEAFNDGITNGYQWYPISGGRQDYMNYFHNCREVTIEQSVLKGLSASLLPSYWNYNRQAMLNYLEQVTYGFRGTITDIETGDPIQAKLEIEGHDFDNSFIFSNPTGYYYRLIKGGTYNLIFSADGYETKTITNQLIADFDSKTIDIQLQKTSSSVENNLFSKIRITNPVRNHNLHINSPLNINQIKIFNVLGQLIYEKITNANELQIDIQNFNSGIYFIDIVFPNGNHIQKSFINPN